MFSVRTIAFAFAVAASVSMPVRAALINGGFESGLDAWTRADQTDPVDPAGSGTFFLQSGLLSPLLGLPAPPPPEGSNAAMTDAAGPGSHVLYQDFLVPVGVPGAFISFSLSINNYATDFFVPAPAHLDFGTPDLNQQARVDLLLVSPDPFSLVVLQNLFQTQPGDPLISGYQNYMVDVSQVLQAHAGQTIRLRFAQVNNVDIFNFGVDEVAINIVPEPAGWLWVSGALFGVVLRLRGRRTEGRSAAQN